MNGTQPVKKERDEKVKDEPKEEVKDELKEEVKDEPKEEVNEPKEVVVEDAAPQDDGVEPGRDINVHTEQKEEQKEESRGEAPELDDDAFRDSSLRPNSQGETPPVPPVRVPPVRAPPRHRVRNDPILVRMYNRAAEKPLRSGIAGGFVLVLLMLLHLYPRPDCHGYVDHQYDTFLKVTGYSIDRTLPFLTYDVDVNFDNTCAKSQSFSMVVTLSSPGMPPKYFDLGPVSLVPAETSSLFGLGWFWNPYEGLRFSTVVTVPWIETPYEKAEFTLMVDEEMKSGETRQRVKKMDTYVHRVSDFFPFLVESWPGRAISIIVTGLQSAFKSSTANAIMNLEALVSYFVEHTITGGIAVGNRNVQGFKQAENAQYFPVVIHDTPGINSHEMEDENFVGQQMRRLDVKRELMRSAQECFELEGCDLMDLEEMHKDKKFTADDYFDIVLIQANYATLNTPEEMDFLVSQAKEFMDVGHNKSRYFLVLAGDAVPEEEQKRIKKELRNGPLNRLQTVFLETYDTSTHNSSERDWNVDLSTFNLMKAFKGVYNM